jgi:hypothetical protein
LNIHRQANDVNSYEEAAQKWRLKFGNDTGNEDDFVATFYEVSQMRKKRGQTGLAKNAGQDTIAAWKKKGSIKNSRGAQLAGEWELAAAEEYFAAKWEPFAITKAAKNIKEAEAQGNSLKNEKTKAEDKYLALDQYGTAELSMAAKVRYGEINLQYSLKLANTPIPTPVQKAADAGKVEILERYQQQLDANVQKYAEEGKKQWLDVMTKAKQGGISNRWSRLALENLGREFPNEYRPLRQEIIQGTEAP